MTDRRLADTVPETAGPETDERSSVRHRSTGTSPMAERLSRPHSREEAEERYIAARDEWTAAMKASASGRSSDLAVLAMAQEAYESALAERQRWASGPTVPIRVEADRPRGIDVIVGQELSWRRVHEHEQEKELAAKARKGVFGRLFRR